MKLKRPYAGLLPPLGGEEREALSADIKERGVLIPVDVDEDGNVLDGHNRLRIDPAAPRRVVKGLTKAEKLAHVYRCNLNRRNLSAAQKRELLAAMKKVAFALRKEDAKKWTQAKVAAALGVDQTTVSLWFCKPASGSNTSARNASTRPDARVKIPPKSRARVAELVAKGESPEQVAADYGVTARTVRSIVTQEAKRDGAKRERQKATDSPTEGTSIIVGDFRKTAPKLLADSSVDLIFTDPPYNEASVSLYGDIAKLASSKLKPGGWCLAYSGQAHLPAVFDVMWPHLQYGWTFALLHTGGDLRFRSLKLQNKWKPIVGFYRSPLAAWWDWFPDVASGGREKGSHAWQQAEAEAAHFISAMTAKHGLVVDPCAGSGTAGVAALRLGRSFIGFEIDPSTAKAANARINDGTIAKRG